MSRIFVTGDTHIPLDIKKLTSKYFPLGNTLTKDDYVIVLGDFGLIWNFIQSDKEEIYWTNWLNNKPWTTLFVDGNHENFERLYKFPTEPKFGGIVGKISDSIYHLKRGEIYTLKGNTIFVMGGATSIDKFNRQEHISWWKEEIPSHSEFENGLANLEKYNNKVEYILTHTGPTQCIEGVLSMHKFGVFDLMPDKVSDPLCNYFDKLDTMVDFGAWYFGHMHENWRSDDGKYNCLYEDIVELDV